MRYTLSTIQSDPDSFWSRIEKTDSCWLWLGATKKGGYGHFHLDGKVTLAHKMTSFLHGVPWKSKLMNTCGTKSCVNPSHWTLLVSHPRKPRPYRKVAYSRYKPSPEKMSWANAKARGFYPKCRDYYKYGAVGRTMCSRWAHSFKEFLADMGPRPTLKHTLDRVNNDGGYWCGKCEECLRLNQPFNCRWATVSEQNCNKKTNNWITANGETLRISQWAERLGTSVSTLNRRVRCGFTPEQAVTVPFRVGCPIKVQLRRLCQQNSA
jgi:hypothetical protein